MKRHRRLTFLAARTIALALLLTGCPLVDPPAGEHSLHVTIVGSGTITTNPQGIDCPGTCTTDFADGTVVDLIATPEPGHSLDTWTGDADCSDARVSMTSERTCVATFQEASGFTSIAGGFFYSLALDHQGHAWAWGTNDFGQIGDGTSQTNRLTPTPVSMRAGLTFTAISAGNHHSLALDQNGHAWGWGENSFGQIGDGTAGTDRWAPTPVTMPADLSFSAVSAGAYHSLALDQNGHAWAWGSNASGEIGDGSTGTDRLAPTPVAMPAGVVFTAISGGGSHSLALDQNGHAWGWGHDAYGQVGDGRTGNVRWAPTPVAMPAGLTFVAVSAGNHHSLALDQNGHAWAWGYNEDGQIGDGTAGTDRWAPTPVTLPADLTFTAISACAYHSLAIDQNGRAWGWGDNAYGQVGDGTAGTDRWSPTPVIMPAGTSFVTVGSSWHSLAIDPHGDAWGWGLNGSGQIGDGTSENIRLVPTAVHMP